VDVLNKVQRHKNMSHIRSKNTKSEIKLRKALWHLGIRYRKNFKLLLGKPDIVITRCRIVIFVDGDFWHGRNFSAIDKRIDVNHDFWINKLKHNMERDAYVNETLTEQGWLVLRFWDSEVKKDLNGCLRTIMNYLPVSPRNKV